MENKQTIMVEREPYEYKGKHYHRYFIRGKVRNQDIKLQVMPHDNGGYTVLDIVYNNEMKAELVILPYEMKDASGNLITGNTFKVRSVDENGEVYECPIKPSRRSDKTLLDMLLR